MKQYVLEALFVKPKWSVNHAGLFKSRLLTLLNHGLNLHIGV